MRYKELKYDGKIYTKKYEIDEILIKNGFNWFIDAEVENVRIEIMKETLILNAGIWYNGVWEYGVIRDVDWRAGTFKNGVIYNGTFKKITVEKGIIFNGKFLKGEILFADIRGGDFIDVNISKTDQKMSNAQDVTITQGEIKGQIGQKIENKVEEKLKVIKFNNFVKENMNNTIIKDENDRYVINSKILESNIKKYINGNVNIENGENDEIIIKIKTTEIINPKNLNDLTKFLETLKGVEMVHYKTYHFEILFDKQVELEV